LIGKDAKDNERADDAAPSFFNVVKKHRDLLKKANIEISMGHTVGKVREDLHRLQVLTAAFKSDVNKLDMLSYELTTTFQELVEMHLRVGAPWGVTWETLKNKRMIILQWQYEYVNGNLEKIWRNHLFKMIQDYNTANPLALRPESKEILAAIVGYNDFIDIYVNAEENYAKRKAALARATATAKAHEDDYNTLDHTADATTAKTKSDDWKASHATMVAAQEGMNTENKKEKEEIECQREKLTNSALLGLVPEFASDLDEEKPPSPLSLFKAVTRITDEFRNKEGQLCLEWMNPRCYQTVLGSTTEDLEKNGILQAAIASTTELKQSDYPECIEEVGFSPKELSAVLCAKFYMVPKFCEEVVTQSDPEIFQKGADSKVHNHFVKTLLTFARLDMLALFPITEEKSTVKKCIV
jgi:hypothetical protein